MAVALNFHPSNDETLEVVRAAEKSCGRDIEVWMDSPEASAEPAAHKGIGEAFQRAFSDDVEFVVYGEDDILPSVDVIELMCYGRKFEIAPQVLCVCAHNHSDHDWFSLSGVAEAAADPSIVRFRRHFSGWIYGIWRDRFRDVLEPVWDWGGVSGGPHDPFGQGPAGQDWNIQRVMTYHGMVTLMPDASRSQNIGQYNGTYAIPEMFPETQSASFREDFGSVEYRLV